MTDNGKNVGPNGIGYNGHPNDKGPKLAINHKGNLVPAHLIPTQFKPGQSGNPLRKNTHPKKKAFVDYLGEFYDEMVTVDVFGKKEEWPRAKVFARMIGKAAMESGQVNLKRDCIGIVIDTLWPKPKDTRPFIQITANHDDRAIGFFQRCEAMLDGAPMTADSIVECLQRDQAKEVPNREVDPDEQSQT